MNYWRITAPVILGSLANIVINYIFNPAHPEAWWSLEEFVVAILFCIPITELNHFIEKKLENKYSWTISPKKRFFYHLLYLTLSLLFILNIIGNLYIWLIGDTFYEWKELFTINLVTFSIAILLTVLKWTSHFYKKWKTSELSLHRSNRELGKLMSKLDADSQHIELQKRNSKHNIKVKEIKIAKIDFGIVKVFMRNGDFYVFHGTLSKLAGLLPEYLFFPVTRSMILHRDVIHAVESSSYGKILIKIEEFGLTGKEITVSRPKASSFRKWYYSTSI